MRLTYDQLVDELHTMSADELTDIAELARHFAIEHRRNEILRNSDESVLEWEQGKLGTPSSDAKELMRRFKETE